MTKKWKGMGLEDCTSASDPTDEHGVGDRGFNDLRYSSSLPPTGCFKVTNIYVNTEGKFVVSYNDVPQE